MSTEKSASELHQEVLALKKQLQDRKRKDERRKRSHQDRLAFEQLLTELSAVFIRGPSKEVNRKMETIFKKIGKLIGLERTDFMIMDQDAGELRFIHSWSVDGAEPLHRIRFSESFPWLDRQLRRDDAYILIDAVDNLPEEAAADKEMIQRLGVTSGLIIPHHNEAGQLLYAVGLATHGSFYIPWSAELIQRLKLFGEILFNGIHRHRQEAALRKSIHEIERLKSQFEKENILLRQKIENGEQPRAIIGESGAIAHILKLIGKVAPTDSTVLVTGETGTGKELVARAIHDQSPRRSRKMVTVNCATLPSSLVEAELFGREKGAYTGAMTRQRGRFEIADGSTIFLDEIGELPMDLQVKLLRVLQENQFERLGSAESMEVDVRVIAATNRNLHLAVDSNQFREDLYYRLNVFPIKIPPLRERPDDILPLAWRFIRELAPRMGRRIDTITESSIEAMQAHDWPGNVRELKNLIERAMIVHTGTALNVEIPVSAPTTASRHLKLQEYERNYILDILRSNGWKIRGKNGAAEILGLKPTTLYSRMKKLNIKRPK